VAQEDARKLSTRIARDTDDRHSNRHPGIMRLNAYLCKRSDYGKMPRFSMACATRCTPTMNAASRGVAS
jgi:hypothetical protein